MNVTEETRNKITELVNITNPKAQIKLFKAYVRQLKRFCIEYLESPDVTQEEADEFLEIIKQHIELLNKAVELAQAEVKKLTV